jgi:hypothetical protein
MSDTNEKAPPPQEEPATQPSNGSVTPDAPVEKKKREYKDFGHDEEKAARELAAPLATSLFPLC